MQIVPSLLFGISASLDALLVGITFGIRGTYVKIWHNVLISTITLLGTYISVGLGSKLVEFLPVSLWKLSGSLILFLFGIYYVIKFMISVIKKYHPQETLTTSKNTPILTFPKACGLGCALSANNMGIGLSASIAGLTLGPAATVTFLFSSVFLFAGNRLGMHQMLQFSEHTIDLITGLLLITLALNSCNL